MNNFQPVPQGGVFNANNYEPQQGGSKHPIGMFPAKITNTAVVPAKDGNSGMFRVSFETPSGAIDKNYSLWHENPQTVEIAHKNVSALCYATNVHQINFANQGRELVNALCTIEVGWQKDNEPGSEKGGPNGGYVEVKKVYDTAGNEPGKNKQQAQPQQQAGWGNQQSQQQPQQNQPMQQQSNGGWSQAPGGNAQPQQNQNQPQGNQPSWGAPQGQQQTQQQPSWANNK